MISREKAQKAQKRIFASFVRSCGKFVLLLSLGFAGCSIPNLEAPECTEARNVVREFYSFHFGNDMTFSQENLKLREKFLTPVYFEKLQSSTSSDSDPFTTTVDFPKAFRVGECRVIEPGNKTEFGILLFWKSDERSDQRRINVRVGKYNDRWLIEQVDQ